MDFCSSSIVALGVDTLVGLIVLDGVGLTAQAAIGVRNIIFITVIKIIIVIYVLIFLFIIKNPQQCRLQLFRPGMILPLALQLGIILLIPASIVIVALNSPVLLGV